MFNVNIAEPLFPRHLVVGGDDDNQNLWMSDNKGETWRKSVLLPYGPGFTSYGASLFQREDKVKGHLIHLHAQHGQILAF